MHDTFSRELNQAQLDAVKYIDGPSLVIAGAGSGKTRVLTYKIAYLLFNGYMPWNILALTFTNKAANEMKERIAALVGEEKARMLNMGTFHSVFSRILRIEAASIGYTPQFTIYDESDSRSLLKTIVKEMELDDKSYKSAEVHKRISLAKNRIEKPADYERSEAYRSYDSASGMEKMPEIYARYQARLHQANAMDFDDILLYTYILLYKNVELQRKYGERFKFVLVDEYQDTNAVQQKIVNMIVGSHNRICVVGDDAQSIYGFRGADIDNILSFQRVFSKMKMPEGGYIDTPVRLFKLEQNYRSTQNIVNAANSLILYNSAQIRKTVFSDNEQGDRLNMKYCYSDREEAIIVSNDIRRMVRNGEMRYSDFAILYRTNSQSRSLEEQLRKDMMPYRIVGGLSFYQRKEIKDVVAYLRLVVNQHDEEALRRIINYPVRGIGATTVSKVMEHSIRLGVSPWQVVSQPAVTGLEVSKATAAKLTKFAGLITYFAERASCENVLTLGQRIIQETGISAEIFQHNDPDDIARQENIQELVNSMREFVDMQREEGNGNEVYLTDFLQQISLMSDIDSVEETDERIMLMTVHSSKGLEFPAVYVVGMDEGIFPSSMSMDTKKAIEEERRLLYVAITRAGKYCTLTSAKNRYRFGKQETFMPSRFISEIDHSLLHVSRSGDSLPFASERKAQGVDYGLENRFYRAQEKSRVERKTDSSIFASKPSYGTQYNNSSSAMRRLTRIPSGKPSSLPSASGSVLSFNVGDRVEHERFGIGEILSIEGTGENVKAQVEFANVGRKQLLLKFARLKKV